MRYSLPSPSLQLSFQESQAPGHLPLQKETCWFPRICPGANVPLYLLCTSSYADTRTRARTQTPPLSGLPLRALGLSSLRAPRDCPGPLGLGGLSPPGPEGAHSRGFLAGPSPGARTPAPEPCGQGHDLSPPPGRRSAPPTGPSGAPRLAVEPGPEGASTPSGGRAERGLQTLARPRKGAVAPGNAPSSSFPPPPAQGLGFPRPTAAKPLRPGEQGAHRAEERDLGRVRCQLLRGPGAAGEPQGTGGEGRALQGARLAGARSKRRQEGSEGRVRRREGRDRGRRGCPPLFTLRWCSHCRGSRSPSWR